MSLQIPELLKNPKVLGATIGGVILIGYMVRNKAGSSNSPVILSTEPDKELVALGIQSRMQDSANQTEIALSQQSNETTLKALAMGNETEFQLAKLNADSSIKLSQMDNEQVFSLAQMSTGFETAKLKSDSENLLATLGTQERIRGAELTLDNIQLSVQQNLGIRQIDASSRIAEIESQTTLEQARIAGNASVAAAKAAKKKGFSIGGYSLRW